MMTQFYDTRPQWVDIQEVPLPTTLIKYVCSIFQLWLRYDLCICFASASIIEVSKEIYQDYQMVIWKIAAPTMWAVIAEIRWS